MTVRWRTRRRISNVAPFGGGRGGPSARQGAHARTRRALSVSAVLVALVALTAGAKSAAQIASSATQQAGSPVPSSWIGLWKGGLRGRSDPPGYTPQLPYGGRSNPFFDALLQPWALEKKLETNGDDDPGSICRPEGPFRTIRVVDFALLAAPGKIVIASSHLEESGYRRIYFDSPHPASLTPSWNGDSRAHWEGDTVVVDTVGLNDKSWINSGHQPHSEALHMVERMRLILGGEYLEVKTTLDDPKAFKHKVSYSSYYKKDNGNGLREHVCNEDPDSHWWRHYKMMRNAEIRTESKP